MTASGRRPSHTLLDACAVLSLYATGHLAEILGTMNGPVSIADLVVKEALFIRQILDGEVEHERVNLVPFIELGLLDVVDANTEQELLTFIDLAVDLDDGEAMSAALALQRNCVLVTDDRKAERLLDGRVHMRSTLDVIRNWAEVQQIPEADLRAALTGVDQRGYRPASRHALYEWWEDVMSDG